MQTCKAIVMERPRQAALRTIQLTEKSEESIVTRTMMSAISSGTDMKTWRGQQHPEQCWYPLVPGYENVGEVIEVGARASGFVPGERVMINECRQFGDVCAAWGGNCGITIKNKFTAPAPFDAPAKIPGNVTYEQAVLAYLAAVALKGAQRLTLKSQDTVVVIGAGMIGISAMQVVRILCPGIKVICIEAHPFRREIAANFADHVLAADASAEAKLADLTGGHKADTLIECSGNPEGVGPLYRYIKDGGWDMDDEPAHIHLQGDYPERIVMDSYHRWFVKNCKLTMSCALKRGGKEQILQWIGEGKFRTDCLPVEVWPAGKCQEAYEYVDRKGPEVFKVLFDWRME